MALFDDVKAAYRAVARGTLTDAEANAIVAQIAADALTLESYIATLTKQAASTTSAAIAIASFITGASPTSDKLDALKIEADKQVASYTKMGVGDPSLGAFEAFGKGFAEDPSTGFATKYGAMSDSAFINAVYAAVYGGAPSEGAFQNLASQIASFTKLYSDAGLANAALLAKGAALGQIVGYAFVDPVAAEKSKLDDQVNKLLTGAANGDASVFGKALPSLDPPKPPNNGGGGTPTDPPQTFELTDGEDKFTGGTGNDIFIAPGDVTTTFTDDDALDGGGGIDTLTINVDVANMRNIAFPANATVKNIEIVEIVKGDATTTDLLDPTHYSGLTQLWQTNTAQDLANWKDGVVAGFRNTQRAITVTAATDASSIAIAFDQAKTSSTSLQTVNLSGDTLARIELSGTLVDGNLKDISPAMAMLLATIGVDIETVSLNTNLATMVGLVSDANSTKDISAFDASASTGAIIYESIGLVQSVKTGSGDDVLKFGAVTVAGTTATLSSGAGDDRITINTFDFGATTIDAGRGNDYLGLLSRSAEKLTIDMGQGDDVLESAPWHPVNDLRAGDVINGGDGFDTFTSLIDRHQAPAPPWSGAGVSFHGIEKLIFSSYSLDLDFSTSTGIKELWLTDTSDINTAFSFSGLASDVAVHLAADMRVTANFKDVDGGDDKAAFFTNGGVWRITAPGIEHLTVDVNGGGSVQSSGNMITALDAKTITIAGNGFLHMGWPAAFTAPLLSKFDASQLTGAAQILIGDAAHSIDGLTVIAPVANIRTDVYTSSNGGALTFVGGGGYAYVQTTSHADIINVGDGGSQILSPGGADKITLGAGADYVSINPTGTSLNAMVEISNFDASEDTLYYPGLPIANLIAGQAAVSQPGVTTIEQAYNAFFIGASADFKFGWFQFSGDTYVATYDDAAGFDVNAGDSVIKLVGLHNLTGANFV